MHYIYILQSQKTEKYHIGSAKDVKKRYIRHNAGSTTSTKSGRPWKIVYTECIESKDLALKREKQIKQMKSRIFIENLINKIDG